ncbi:tail component [Escherichia coli]|uniref:Tail component n=1 Tax=Escherichia coli TaxID=562 RepID=A0A376VKW9_ECOLX|nr:tail component [Escherichia coli]
MVRLPPVVMSAKSATARTTIAREDAEDHQVKLSSAETGRNCSHQWLRMRLIAMMGFIDVSESRRKN